MAHTVETLAKLLKKTSDEVIVILSNAGIEGKNASSEITADERKVLMSNLTKRVTPKPSDTNKTQSASGVKVQVKASKKPAAVQPKVSKVDVDKAREALNKGQAQNIEQEEQDKKRKEKIEEQKKLQQENEANKNKTAKAGASRKYEKDEKDTGYNPREELHLSDENHKRKLKKKDRTKLSQKLREDQAQHAFHKPVDKVIHDVPVPENIKVSELALKMKTKAGEVLKVLMGMGVMATLNDVLDQDTALLVVEEMGHNGIASVEETVEDKLIAESESSGDAVARPPVVAIMGHVDHGKTSLLDYIRKAKVADGEAGGITQHIGAYQVKSKDKSITFIDTPGHAAFSKMRSRGANSTDIIILVVAADDGVMPQTIESIKHSKKAGVPMIVAINKMDKEGASPDKVKQVLSTHDVIAEDWGGDVMMVPVSAHTGQGVDDLLDAISLTAEILEFKAVNKGSAKGIVLEARLDKGRGKVTTVLVQEGQLKQGDIVIAGVEFGKIKQIMNDQGKAVKTADPSTPVEILGLSGVPNAGEDFLVVENERKAREVADFRRTKERDQQLKKQQAAKMDNFLSKMEEGDISTVSVLIKSDVRGSAQALVDAIEELSTDEVRVNVISSGVGAINNTDITLASTSDAIVLGFNVRADAVARKTAENEGVKIEYYSVIYNLIDDVKAIMSGMLSPELSENIIGIATVKEVFRSPKFGDIAGCIVDEGVVRRDAPIRVLRESIVIYEGELESLRRFKDDVKEVKSGTECGIGVLNYTDVQPGDQIEVFERVETSRSL